jgi:1-acyl-sn-glycerol-3-phosphate acyltransferase
MKPTLLHRITFAILRVLLRPFFWLFLGYKAEIFNPEAYGVKPPYLILSPHFSKYDPFLLSLSFSRPVCFVDGGDITGNRFAAFLMRKVVGLIQKPEFVSDIGTIKDIAGMTENGGTVALFAEDIGYSGEPLRQTDSAVAKIVRHLKIPVVFYRFDGMYFTVPRWGRLPHRRKPCARGFVSGVMKYEEYEGLSEEQLSERIVYGHEFNEYRAQRTDMYPYACARPAEYLERALYICPHCNTPEKLRSSKSLVMCLECGYVVRYNKYNFFESVGDGAVYFDNVTDWYNWQVESLNGADFSGVSADTVLLSDEYEHGIVCSRTSPKSTLKRGQLRLYVDRFEHGLAGDRRVFKFSDITDVLTVGARCLVLRHKNGFTYKFKGRPARSALKYQQYFRVLYRRPYHGPEAAK